MDLFVPAMSVYFVWWVLYLVYVYLVGRFLGVPDSQYDTQIHYTFRTNKTMAGFCGYDGSTREGRSALVPQIKHQIFHALLVGAQTAFSCLMWHHYWVHSLFCFFILSVCAYNGAIRYYKMMTLYFIKNLETLKVEIDEKKEN